MLDCGCFFHQGNKFPDFCEILTDELNNKSKRMIFESKFLKMMMLEYWSPYQWKVIKAWLIPQFAYIFTSVHYFAAVLDYDFAK